MSLLRPLNESNWIEPRAESADSHHVYLSRSWSYMLITLCYCQDYCQAPGLPSALFYFPQSPLMCLQVMNKNNKRQMVHSFSHNVCLMLSLPKSFFHPEWVTQLPLHVVPPSFVSKPNWTCTRSCCISSKTDFLFTFTVHFQLHQEASRPDVKDPQGAPELHHIAPCFSKVCLALIRWTHNDCCGVV